jgi:hypothetical protein
VPAVSEPRTRTAASRKAATREGEVLSKKASAQDRIKAHGNSRLAVARTHSQESQRKKTNTFLAKGGVFIYYKGGGKPNRYFPRPSFLARTQIKAPDRSILRDHRADGQEANETIAAIRRFVDR